ncbi:MAG: ATP-binding protein [Phycisphaeraceae bacterium]|nr:ATP-binding protein [Phycisphaeraceae bacterium]
MTPSPSRSESVAQWLQKAVHGLDQLWHPKRATFLQNSNQLLIDPERFYPTCTFVSVSSLHAMLEELRRSDGFPEGIRYNDKEFVQSLEGIGASEAIAISDLTRRGSGESPWNPFTAGWLVRSLLQIHNSNAYRRCIGESGAELPTKLAGSISSAVRTQCELLLDYLESDSHAKQEVGHPFLTYLSYYALTHAFEASLSNAIPNKTRDALTSHAEDQCYRLLGMYSAGSWAPTGLLYLVNAAGILAIRDPLRYRELITASLTAVGELHCQTGTWPLLRTSFNSGPVGPLAVSAFEIGLHVAEIARRTLKTDEVASDTAPFMKILSYLDALYSSARKAYSSVTVQVAGNSAPVSVSGWGDEQLPRSALVESWVTAYVGLFLSATQELRQLARQQTVLSRYSAKTPSELRASAVSWEDIGAEDVDVRYFGYIQTRIIDTIRLPSGPKPDAIVLPHRSKRNVSLLLFGPPGTSKTTIVSAVAQHLGWPLVTLSPGVFLNEGQHAIDKRASEVFIDLNQLERVVILFDECDGLFLARDAGKGEYGLSVTALITGAMLPRLQDLHDRGRLVFVLSTNRITAIDPAIRRPGRFDHIVGIGPPGKRTRAMLAARWLPQAMVAKELRDVLVGLFANATKNLTRSEIKSILDEFGLKWRGLDTKFRDDVSHVQEVAQQVVSSISEDARMITPEMFKQFKEERDRYCLSYRQKRPDSGSRSDNDE